MTLDETLRSLDAAGPVTEEDHERAAAALDRIVATPYDATPPVRRSRRRLLIAVAAAAAAAAGAIVILPGNLGGGRAYASWTPVPSTLTDAEIAMIGPECRDGLKDGSLDIERAELVLAERRGEYVAMLYRTDDPDVSGSCLAHNVPGDDDVDDVNWGVGGSSGPSETAPAGHYMQGAIADFKDASITDGAVGPDVSAVTIRTGDLTVQATVRNGRYVVWWPGPAFEWASKTELREIFTVDLTLRDGTVITAAEPWRPR
ncbi:hypothetical protein OHA21_50810 [Actinoplanes sp. NBC_00393]|uniref:hypothetical protein n=1 Tax=Actinoplanes sp. NBC_00393 TaxID=2975953 RepID=UPI002E1CB656